MKKVTSILAVVLFSAGLFSFQTANATVDQNDELTQTQMTSFTGDDDNDNDNDGRKKK